MSTIANSIKGSLSLTLQAYRVMLERQFGLKNVTVVTNDNSKEDSRRQNGEVIKYPKSKLKIQEVRAYKDVANGKNIARHGWFSPASEVTESTTLKYYIWPVAIGTELEVAIQDPEEALTMCEKFIVAASTDALNYKLELMPGIEIIVRAEVPDTMSIPLSESDSTEHPGATVLSLQVALYSWIGFARDVNRASGTVAQNVGVRRT